MLVPVLVAARALLAAGAPAPASEATPAWTIAFDRVAEGNRDLYAVSAGGGAERRLTHHPADDSLPRYSRDGSRIVYSSERSGSFQVWEVPAEGGPARRLRSNGAREWQADPSPDGRRLALLSDLDGFEKLRVMDLVSGKDRVLVAHGRSLKGRRTVLGNTHWSPDGRSVAFSSNVRIGHQIYVVDVATGEERRVSPLAQGGCEPRFSPDGRKVVYVTRRLLGDRSRIVEHDLGSGRETILVDWPALNYDPVYSPDGSEVAFASNGGGRYALHRLRISDGRSWRLTSGPGDDRNPDYRPR
jgi:TolB protein